MELRIELSSIDDKAIIKVGRNAEGLSPPAGLRPDPNGICTHGGKDKTLANPIRFRGSRFDRELVYGLCCDGLISAIAGKNDTRHVSYTFAVRAKYNHAFKTVVA